MATADFSDLIVNDVLLFTNSFIVPPEEAQNLYEWKVSNVLYQLA